MAAAAALVAGAVGVPSAQAVTTLEVPAAAATLPEVVMACNAGQVDINHASATQLATQLQVDPPVASRVVAMRPYLQPKDLLVVPGIGATVLARILGSSVACATPPQEPPPAFKPCTARQPDAQSSSAADIAKRVGISLAAAERIVAARPFATLAHVTPERVPGVGKGVLDRFVSKTCLTPSPVRTDSSSWRWAYQSLTTSASRDGFVLEMPAGTLDQTGAWLSITPNEAPPARLPGPTYPSADFHVHGPWEGDGDQVVVTVPAAAYAETFDSDWQPYLLHYTDPTRTQGEPITEGVSVDSTTGAVTAAVTNLSPIDWAVHKLNWAIEPTFGALFGNRFGAPSCTDPWTEEPGTNGYTHDGARAELTGALLDLPGNPVPLSGFLIKHCVESAPSSYATDAGPAVRVRLRNSTGTIQRLKAVTSYGAEVKGDSALPDLVAWALTQPKDGNFYLAPGATGEVVTPAGTFSSVDMVPDRLRSLSRIGLDKTLGEIFDRLGPLASDPTFRQSMFEIIECAYETVKATSGDNVAELSTGLARAVVGCFDFDNFWVNMTARINTLEANGTLSGDDAQQAFDGLLELRELIKWLEVAHIAVDVGDSLLWGSLGSSLVMTEHYAKKPTRDSQGRIVRDACVSEYIYSWRINETCQNAYYASLGVPTGGGGETGLAAGRIIRNTAGNAWLYTTEDRVMRPIPDGGTYICLAKHYAVDWAVDGTDLAALRSQALVQPEDAPDATCDGSLAPSRDLRPGSASLNSAIVLRQATGASWVVNSGERVSIPSGGEFLCWVNPEFSTVMEWHVWDYVSDEELARFPISTSVTYISNCGDPQHPEF